MNDMYFRTKDAAGKQKRESAAALASSHSTAAAQPAEKSKVAAVVPRPADETLSETKSSQDRICSSLSASSSSDSEMSEAGSNEDSEEESKETQIGQYILWGVVAQW